MATDTQVSDTLRRFAARVTTASVKERQQILSDLGSCVNGKDLPDGAVKGLCKLFCLTLHRYRDATSRRALQAVIEQLAESHPETTTKHLVQCLQSTGITCKNGHPSKSSASAASLALNWTLLLVKTVFKAPEKQATEMWIKMVEVQCLLLAEVLGGGNKHTVNGILKKFRHLWKENSELAQQYLATTMSLEQNQLHLAMLGVLVQYCTDEKDIATINKHKNGILELYVKTVLLSKIKPPKYLLERCEPLLRHVSHQEFKGSLLPTVHKSILRSPENVIETISYLLSSVTLDLSQYAVDIVKGLASQLKSNNPQLMDEAVIALRNLTHQCSDPAAAESLVRHLFAILGGSEGKLTAVAQKISVLSGIGSCSHHTVSGLSSQTLSGTVTELFIPFLQQEVHEGTLLHAISILALWCSKFTTEVPKKLVEWFKKAFTLKTSTSAIRHAYLQCMLASFHGDTVLQALELLPLFLQTVEKVASQNTHVPIITEGVAAAVLICRLSLVDTQVESKLTTFWALLLDEKKQFFTSEKFLSLASEDGLCTVLQLTERLLLDLPEIKGQMYHKALVTVLLSKTWRVRKQAQQTVRKLLSSLGGVKLAYGLLEEFQIILNTHKVIPLERLITESGEPTEAAKFYVQPRILVETLCVITSIPGLENDVIEAKKLARDIVFMAHHPSIGRNH